MGRDRPPKRPLARDEAAQPRLLRRLQVMDNTGSIQSALRVGVDEDTPS